MTKLYFEGQLPLKTNFIHESILGTQFTGQLIDVTKVSLLIYLYHCMI